MVGSVDKTIRVRNFLKRSENFVLTGWLTSERVWRPRLFDDVHLAIEKKYRIRFPHVRQ
jgi:hypothetical protein